MSDYKTATKFGRNFPFDMELGNPDPLTPPAQKLPTWQQLQEEPKWLQFRKGQVEPANSYRITLVDCRV